MPRRFPLPPLAAAAFLALAFTPLHAQRAEPPRREAAVDSLALAAVPFRMVGPFRGGRSTAVAGIAAEPHVFLMGTTGGGVWRTDDAGQTWRNISDGFFGGSIGAVAIAPRPERDLRG